MNIFKHTLLLTILLIGFHCVPTKSESIEQVVVTGTRTEKTLEESPISIDVITDQEIDMVSRGTLAQALNYIPGITVRRNEKDGFNVFMQGFDSDRVLVLIDGQALVSPTGNSIDLSHISALNVAQIEVIKGPASVLYGSAAMGGVINIITKNRQNNFLTFSSETGRYLGNEIQREEYRRQANISAGLFNKTWSGQLLYQYFDNPGFEYDANTIEHDAGEVEKNFFQGSVQKQWSKERLELKTKHFTEDKYKITGPFPGEGDDVYQSNVEQFQYDLALRSENGWHILSRYNVHDERSGQRTGLRNTQIDNIDIDTQYTWQSKHIDWVTGAHYYREGIDQKTALGIAEVNDESRDGTELFLQADWYATEQWEIIAGIRAQNDSGYGHHSAARLNTQWQKFFSSGNDLKWRSTLGQGYRVPTLKERFFFFDHSDLGYQIIGSPDLRPETTLSFNSGVEYTITRPSGLQLRTEISAHYSEAIDFINTEFDPGQSALSGFSIFVYQNEDEVTISGADFSIDIITTRHKYQFNYAYVDARNAISQERLGERPYHQVKANYWWYSANNKVDALFYLVYEKDQDTAELIRLYDDFFTANASLNIRLTDRFSWRLGIENIFDDHQNTRIDSTTLFDPRPIDSRFVFAGFKYQFH